MILSVSRRTDIPAFYSDWFFRRIQEGYLLVRNPLNSKQVSRINLSPSVIDCIVFWTKNPQPMISRLNELKDYKYYFHFTLNSYDITLEPSVPRKNDLIKTFADLSNLIGKEKVIWRYDPIILTDTFTKEYHYKWFEVLASHLYQYTNRCVISFLDLYKKTERNLKEVVLQPIETSDMEEIAERFSKIASKYNLTIEACSEKVDLKKYNIQHSKCIDDRLISEILNQKLHIDKDPNQRNECGCVRSIDVGAYNTCKHFCLYCYANYSKDTVYKNTQIYDSESSMLIGKLNCDEKVTEREMHSYKNMQISFLD